MSGPAAPGSGRSPAQERAPGRVPAPRRGIVGGELLALATAQGAGSIAYGALPPLLPHYLQVMHLSVRYAGVLTATFAMGALLGAVPACIMAGRNPRATVFAGLVGLSLGTLVTAWADEPLQLALARSLQGFGDALACTGGLTAMFEGAHLTRRSESLGRVNTLAIGGAFLGPVLALAAGEFGPRLAFCCGALGLALLALSALWLPRRSGAGEPARLLITSVARALGDLTTFPLAVQAALGGLLATLGSLRLVRAGWSSSAVAVAFLCGAAVGALGYTRIGRRCDARGPRAVTSEVLLASVAGTVAFALVTNKWALAATLSLDAALFSLLAIPTISVLFARPGQKDRPHGSASALSLAVWAVFNLTGALCAASLAGLLGTSVPFLIAAGVCAATAITANLGRLRTRLA